MRVMLLTASAGKARPGPLDSAALDKLRECQQKDRFGVHELTDDPDRADLILFAEMEQGIGARSELLRRHPLLRRHRDKCFAYSAADRPIAFVPGIYASIERRYYDPARVRSGHYLSTHLSIPPLVDAPAGERDLLFSFQGNAENHRVRRVICRLKHPRARCEDTSAVAHSVWRVPQAAQAFLRSYAETLARSQFALCPRGMGASSIRLFESMRAGCAPVIVADDWVPPEGPDWDSFSLRIAERDADRIPALLERQEQRARAMGERARQAWEQWFSDEVSFHRLVEWCDAIRRTRLLPERLQPGRFRAYAELLRPAHAKGVLRSVVYSLLGSTKTASAQAPVPSGVSLGSDTQDSRSGDESSISAASSRKESAPS